MTNSIQLKHPIFLFGIPILLLVVLVFLMTGSQLPKENVWYLSITADLILTVPLVYFLLIRKTKIPKTTVIPFLIVGILLGSYLLPAEGQTYLDLFKTWVLPVIELSILLFVVIHVRRAVKEFRLVKSGIPDFYTTVKLVCARLFPSTLAALVATEIAVFYYGFVSWKKRKLTENEFSYHRESGTPAMLGAFIFIIGVETFVLHILLVGWSPVVAWVLSGLSIYTGLQILGMAKSLGQRPIELTETSVILKYGILNETELTFSAIESIEYSTKSFDKTAGIKRLSPLGELEGHNVIIYLCKEHAMNGMYGLRKRFKSLAIHVDEHKIFIEKVCESIAKVTDN